MARRSRENRQEIPGYDDSRPSRGERKQQHRAARHATHQKLHMVEDPDEVVLPGERRTRRPVAQPTDAAEQPAPARKRRFKVWKTKFWKRRDSYRDMRAELDAEWPVITPTQLGEGSDPGSD